MFVYFQYYAKKIFDFVKKAFIVIAVYVVIVSLFFHFTSKNKENIITDISTVKETEALYKLFTNPDLNTSVSGNILRGTLCFFVGEVCTDNPHDARENFKHSVFGFITNLITLPFANPPASGTYWVYSGLQNAGFVPKSYAAEGIGFAALAPFQEIWKMFRNFVFMIMVLFIVAIGFMIMFRTKINQQTVISIENSLPRIVIALLLITFSYPIAGFLIDLMYISIGFIVTLFASNSLVPFDKSKLLHTYLFSTDLGPWDNLMPIEGGLPMFRIASSMYRILPIFVQTTLDMIIGAFLPRLAFNLVPLMFGGIARGYNPYKFGAEKVLKLDFIKDAAGKITRSGTLVVSVAAALFEIAVDILIGSILGQYMLILILTLLLIFSLIFIFFRIFFMLLSAYINSLLLIIFSPVILAIEAIPGKSAFSSWIKNLALNLMTFPLVVIFTLLAAIIIRLPEQTQSVWMPPFLTFVSPSAFQVLIGGAILFMTPDLIKLVKQLTGVKPLPIDLNFGSFFSGGQAAVGGGVGLLGQIGSVSLGMGAVKGFLGKSKEGKPLAQEIAEAFKAIQNPQQSSGPS